MGEGGEVWKVLETAGGVASPGASGTLQCDLYRCACLSLLAAWLLISYTCLISLLDFIEFGYDVSRTE